MTRMERLRTLEPAPETVAETPDVPSDAAVASADGAIEVEGQFLRLEASEVPLEIETPLERWLPPVTLGSTSLGVVALVAWLGGSYGTVPGLAPAALLALGVLSFLLGRTLEAFLVLDNRRRCLDYVRRVPLLGTRRTLCRFEDVVAVAVAGRRERRMGAWWWSYGVVAVLGTGQVLPLLEPVDEDLALADRNARALAARFRVPAVPGVARAFLGVKKDPASGIVSAEQFEQGYECFDAWPDLGSFTLWGDETTDFKRRTIE